MSMITTSDGVKLYVEEAGEGTPILFIHEFGGNHASWEPQIRYFSRRHRCITYAARGYPPSDVPSSVDAYSQALAADDAVAVLDGLGIGPCPDQAAYGDAGSDTLGNVARAVGGLRLANLERLGLGKCRDGSGINGFDTAVTPTAAYGVARPASAEPRMNRGAATSQANGCPIPPEIKEPDLVQRPPRTAVARGFAAGFPCSGGSRDCTPRFCLMRISRAVRSAPGQAATTRSPTRSRRE